MPSVAPQPAKKNVSWNDSVPAQPTANPPAPTVTEVPTNGGTNSSGITLEDIDEVLGSSAEQDESSALVPNTPNVIGSQEVYRDPRERMIQEKMRNKPQATAQGQPEQLSFKEKMKMFAIQNNAAAQKNAASQKSGQRERENGNGNAIPEEET